MDEMDDVLAITGGTLLEAGRDPRAADVLIRDGAIAAVGAIEVPAGARTIDATGDYLAPGLINSHYHSAENFNPGFYENLPLDLWFVHSHQVTRQCPPDPETIYARTMLGAMQMLRRGTTAVVDFVFEAPRITLATLEPIIRAYRDVGMRATILLGVADKPFADSLPLLPEERARWTDEAEPIGLERIMELGAAAVERWHEPGGLIGIGFGPSAPQRCSAELMSETLEFSCSRGLAWQSHVLETKTQAWTARQWHGGRSFVDVLAERGLLGEHAALVHTVWLDHGDIATLAGTGTGCIHCPYSNLRLGDGIAPIPALRRAGVRVGLGTDGRGCDETLDMLELARAAALLHKVRGEHHSRWTTAAEAYSMVTAEASAFTGHGDRLGRIEPGARADLLIVGGAGLTFTPLHDPVRQLIYGGSARDIRRVIVGGSVAVADGELTRVDEVRMLELARAAAARELPHLEASQETGRIGGLVEALYRRAEASELGFAAYGPR